MQGPNRGRAGRGASGKRAGGGWGLGTNGGPENEVVGESSSGEGDWPIGWQCALAGHGGNLCGDNDQHCKGLWSCGLAGDQAQSGVGGEPWQKHGVCCVVGVSRGATGGWRTGGIKVGGRCWWPADGSWARWEVFQSK